MKITCIATGKQKGYLGEDTVLEYMSRLVHYMPVSWVYVHGSDIRKETQAILNAIPERAYVVALDERGKNLSSRELATVLEKRLNESTQDLVFIIGGAYGIGDAVQERANLVWSLSNLTFPHELVRSILVEAVYRACTIVKGEKYHHAYVS